MKMFPAVKGWMKEVEAWCQREAEEGRIVPGQKLVPKRAQRHFKSGVSALTFLETMCGLTQKDIFETKMKSVAQTEKVLKEKKLYKIVKDAFDAQTVKISSGNTLVPESDNRIGISVGAKEVFGDVIDKPKLTEADIFGK